MTRSLGLAIPLWFLRDLAQPTQTCDLLEQALGEIGPQHLTITLVAAPQRIVRPRGPGPVPAQTSGGWQYPPNAGAYADAGLVPPRERICGRSNLLKKAIELLGRYELPGIARCDVAGASLVGQHPHLAQRTAWGTPLEAGTACCAHPEVRALLLDLVGELRGYEFTGLQLAGWELDRGLRDEPNCGPREKLLSACFCPSCQQVARSSGVDPDAAAAQARDTLASGGEPALPEFGPLADYITARQAEARTWLQVLRERSGSMTLQQLQRGPTASGGLSPVVDLYGEPAPLDLTTWFENAEAVNLPVHWPHIPTADALVRTTQQLLQHGVHWLDFDGLALDPHAETRTAVRQAMRYAQRGD